MTPVPPVQLRATRMARSFASLPVQVNITCPTRTGMSQELLGIIENHLVQVARMGIEDGRLFGRVPAQHGDGMPDAGDIVVDIEIGIAIRIVQPDALAADDVDGMS